MRSTLAKNATEVCSGSHRCERRRPRPPAWRSCSLHSSTRYWGLYRDSNRARAGETVIGREPFDQLVSRHRPHEMVALHDFTAGIGEERLLAMLLYSFGDDSKFELFRELQQRLNHHFARLVLADASDEMPVEFEAIDGEPGQIAQRRIASAEIVD